MLAYDGQHFLMSFIETIENVKHFGNLLLSEQSGHIATRLFARLFKNLDCLGKF